MVHCKNGWEREWMFNMEHSVSIIIMNLQQKVTMKEYSNSFLSHMCLPWHAQFHQLIPLVVPHGSICCEQSWYSRQWLLWHLIRSLTIRFRSYDLHCASEIFSKHSEKGTIAPILYLCMISWEAHALSHQCNWWPISNCA